MTAEPEPLLDLIERAHQQLNAACQRGRLRMSVPARPDEDDDLVISSALYRAEERIAAREAQLANLRRIVESWADRGMVLVSDVLAELDEVDITTTPPEAEVDAREDEE